MDELNNNLFCESLNPSKFLTPHELFLKNRS